MPSSQVTASQRLQAFGGSASLDDALALYDALPPVSVQQLLGAWRGTGLTTGNPLDGLLEALRWHGKRFDGPDEAHPLVFADERGVFSVDPALVPLSLVVGSSRLVRRDLVGALGSRPLRLLRTRKPKARLRMVEYRGVVTGTMTYDALPVNDHFREVDPDTLLGAMDARGLEVPLMFVLRREAGSKTR